VEPVSPPVCCGTAEAKPERKARSWAAAGCAGSVATGAFLRAQLPDECRLALGVVARQKIRGAIVDALRAVEQRRIARVLRGGGGEGVRRRGEEWLCLQK
jgi:hypothetical protein